MVKYMRKSKVIGEVAVMEVNHAHAAVQSSLGVRTRAKTLALQKSSAEISGDDGSYLQLRSRRLVKPTPPIVPEAKRKKHPQPKSGKGKVGPLNFEEEKEEQIDGLEGKLEAEENNQKDEKNGDGGEMEASFGENMLEYDDKERWFFSFIFSFNFLFCMFKDSIFLVNLFITIREIWGVFLVNLKENWVFWYVNMFNFFD